MTAKEFVSEERFENILENACNFVSVLETGNRTDAIENLVCLVLYEFNDECLSTPIDVIKIINDIFLIELEEKEVESIITVLIDKCHIKIDVDNSYIVNNQIIEEIQNKKNKIKALEESIKNNFIKDIKKHKTKENPEKFWDVLYAYLSLTFRRHGMQASALLSGEDIALESNHDSLTELLHKSINKHLSYSEDIEIAKKEISKFMSSVTDDNNKTNFIVTLADGAFNYFLLSSDPIASKNLRNNLEELVIFLDTNFLFGILSLHNNIQVSISNNLLDAITKHKFPFKLRYKEKTLEEIKSTLSYYGGILRSREWNQGLSRAVASLPNSCSGIELKFHEKNAKSPLSPEEFMRPFQYVDALLKEKNIEIDDESLTDDEFKKDLCSNYKQFLEDHGKWGKSYNVMYHDASLLWDARKIRKNNQSSLNAGAIIITCDYSFYKFDMATCKHNNTESCVLLPSLFWQILRPYIPSDKDWDKAFASTFSLPEFRTISSNSSVACTKMLQILASHKDIPENVAVKMLSNDLLLKKLSHLKSEDEFKKAVESELVNENNILQEEIALLKIELNEVKKTVEEEERQRNIEKEKRVSLERKIQKEKIDAEEVLKKAQEQKQQAEEARKSQEKSFSAVKKREFANRVIITILLSIAASIACIFFMNTLNLALYGISILSRWGLAFQITLCAAICLIIAAIILKEYRRTLFIIFAVDGFAIFITLLSSMPSASQ